MRFPLNLTAVLTVVLGFSSCMAPPVRDPGPTVWSLRDGLDPLKSTFNANQDAPRLVILAPPSCAETLQAIEQAQAEVAALGHDREMVWMVVWQDELANDGLHTAVAACESLRGGNIVFFHDEDWLAGVRLARGTVLSGNLKRAFLFYPPGAVWEGVPPEPSFWVHRTGVVCAENLGGVGRLTEVLRGQWSLIARPR